MSRKNTDAPAKHALKIKLRAEVKKLEKALSEVPVKGELESPELSEFACKWNLLHRGARVSVRQYTSPYRLNREDATLRGSWLDTGIDRSFETPVDKDWSDKNRDTTCLDEIDALRGGGSYGAIPESPEKPGPRFHTPVWVRDRNQLYKFNQRLLRVYKKGHPTLSNFMKSKTEVESRILFDYFVNHLEYAELYDKYRQPKNDIYDVSAKFAKSIQEAIEYAAKKNGTFATFEEGGNVLWDLGDGDTAKVTPSWFDQVEHKFKLVTARKVNADIFRVELHNDAEDAYYLPEKLDPTKRESTRGLQRYIEALADEGYRLLKITKPDANVRAAKRQVRQAEEEMMIARNQLGRGTNALQYEHTATLSDQSYKPSQARALNAEYGRLSAWENKLTGEAEAKATEGLDAFQLWRREQARGEKSYQKLMALTKVDEAVARFTRPWQPPVVEVEPTVTPIPFPARTVAIQHDVLRGSIQLFLAAIVQGYTWQGPEALAA